MRQCRLPVQRQTRQSMAIYGYARASTVGQDVTLQQETLRRAGCEVVRSEKSSGASRSGRSELAVLLQFLRRGDTLMVTRVDRLALSIKDLQLARVQPICGFPYRLWLRARLPLKRFIFAASGTGSLQRCKLFPFIQFRLRCEKGGCLARSFSLGCHTTNSLDGNFPNAGYRGSLGCVADSASASASAFSIVHR